MLALVVCMFFYSGAGKYSITFVPREVEVPVVKRQILL